MGDGAYPGADRYALRDAIQAVPLAELLPAGIDALLGCEPGARGSVSRVRRQT